MIIDSSLLSIQPQSNLLTELNFLTSPHVSPLLPLRLLVVRLLSPLQPCHLTFLAEELEESVGCHVVTVVLQCRRDEPHAVLVAALPSRDLSWELNKLRAQGYSGLPETSSDISMCEGDQLLLRFSGNITSTGRVWGWFLNSIIIFGAFKSLFIHLSVSSPL